MKNKVLYFVVFAMFATVSLHVRERQQQLTQQMNASIIKSRSPFHSEAMYNLRNTLEGNRSNESWAMQRPILSEPGLIGMTTTRSVSRSKVLLTLCTTVKNDVPYIVEWIEYMKMQGVDRFIIYNDDSWEDLDLLNDFYLQRNISSEVYVIPRAGRPRYQLVSFDHCVRNFGNLTDWILISDTDEFLFSPTHGTLRSMLINLPAYETALNKTITHIYADCSRFGSSGQKRRFQYRLARGADGRVDYVNGCGVQLVLSHTRRAPHVWLPKEKELAQRLRSAEVCRRERENQGLGCHHGHGKSLFRPEHVVEVGCHFPARMDGAGVEARLVPYKGGQQFLARCFHYSTRSREDAYRKAVIGWRFSSLRAVSSLFNDTDAFFFGAVDDPSLRDEYMPPLARRMAELTTVRGACLPDDDDAPAPAPA